MKRRHIDRFDDNAADIRSPIHDKNAAHDVLLRSPTTRTLHERISPIRATVQRKLRWMENNRWARKAPHIQNYANINDVKNFHEALHSVYGPTRFSLHPVRSTDGVLIKNNEMIVTRWDDVLQNLLNKVHNIDPGFLDDLPTLQIIAKLDDPPFFDEVEKAILSLKDNKTAGTDSIPAEVNNMMDVLYTEGCIVLSLTAGPLSVSHRNDKMPTLFLYTSKRVTEQNMETAMESHLSL